MKKMWKYAAVVLVCVLTLGACGNLDSSKTSGDAAQDRKIQIGMSFDSFVIERWQTDRDIFVSTAKELGAEVNVQNANGDLEQQKKQINYFIDKGMDVIVIICIDSEGLAEQVQKAKEAGIKVIAYDRMIMDSDIDLYITFDNERVGTMMGEALVDNGLSGGKVLMLGGSAVDSNVAMVEKGFRKVMEDHQVTVRIDGKKSSVSALRESYRDGKAYTISVDTNRDDEVTEILAVSKFSSNNKGKLSKISKRELTIVAKEKDYTYSLADDVDVTINGKSRDVSDLIDSYKDYSFNVTLGFDKNGDVREITAEMADVKEGHLRDLVEDKRTITVTAAGLNIKMDLASSVTVKLGGESISLTKLNSELDYAYGDSQIYVELGYNGSGEVKTITAFWEDARGELVSVDRRADEIEVRVNGSKKTFEISTRAEFVYKLSAAADADDYKRNLRYDEDLYGLQDFLDACSDARDDCTVALTKDSKGKIVRICAIAG